MIGYDLTKVVYDGGMNNNDAVTAKIATELRVARERIQGERPTNTAIGKQVGISTMAVGRYLNGERAIPIPTFIAICRVLGVDPGQILDKID